jgi:ATP-binding cassette subfamily B protein
VRVVKAFATFDQEVARFDVSNTDLTRISVSAGRVMSVFSPVISFIVNAGVVFTLWLARDWVADQTMQVGQVVAFINYMTQILFSLNMIFNVYQQFIRAKASAERVGEVLMEESDPVTAKTAADTGQHLKGHIRFENVSFSYPSSVKDSVPVLQDISFELLPRETLGVIGSTGAGKSSLVHLIPAFYTPTGGAIHLDGRSLIKYDSSALRGQIALVAQQSVLFYGTVADNIRMGKPDATIEEITIAAKAAQAHDFIIAFPDGYDTWIGQRGVNLSGGQKQRISIARALVRKASVLILDDCVSAVDVETEAAIMRAVYNLTPTPTCVMISQRISSVIHLSKILVLDEGRVAGYGSHQSLMENSLVYQEIYRSQLM